ncbi:hypothetical protein A3Q56_00346 [Intoshia linei]|uniref:Transporter n=1 Tax=Intoshia linei TaxID=1819745 RepID=A0A177BC23_9BILA|nr:hypothetical protein A3Q56_00346 [Intoshia linei]
MPTLCASKDQKSFKINKSIERRTMALFSNTSTILSRQNWSNKFQFIFSCIGYAVGLGNIWRFPYLCYENGGAAFLIPYFIFLIICGIPLFKLEISLGQFSSVGYGLVITSAMLCIYYNVIMSWALYYFIYSFFPTLPWSIEKIQGMNNKHHNVTFFDASKIFYSEIVLNKSTGLFDINFVCWHLFGCLIFVWIITFICVVKGVQYSGKIMQVTATLPYVIFLIFTIRAGLLPGAVKGLKYFIIPNVSKLLEIKVWITAAHQMIFNLGTGLEFSMKILIPHFAAGAIIGKGGDVITQMQKDYNIHLEMSRNKDLFPGENERYMLLFGNVQFIISAVTNICKIIEERSGLVNNSQEFIGRSKTLKILIPNHTAGLIIGSKGESVLRIKEISGAEISISRKDSDFLPEKILTLLGTLEERINAATDSIIVPLVTSISSVFFGLSVFAMLGNLANDLGSDIHIVDNESGIGLIFIAFPAVMSQLQIPQLWSVMFFFTILLIGMDSQFAMLQTVTCSLLDQFPKLRRFNILLNFTLCFLFFCCGIICVTDAGYYIILMLNDYVVVFTMIFFSLCETIAVAYIYGTEIRKYVLVVKSTYGPKNYDDYVEYEDSLKIIKSNYLWIDKMGQKKFSIRNPSEILNQ